MAPVVQFLVGVFGAVGSFIGGLGFFGKMLVNIGLNFAVRALLGQDDQDVPLQGVSFDVEYGANQPRKVPMGLIAVAGTAEYDNSYDEANKYWQRVFKLADYPMDGLSRVSIDGEYVTLGSTEEGTLGYPVTTGDAAGFVWIKFHDGRQTEADPGLVANANPATRWTSTAVGDGVCYAVVTSLFDRMDFAQAPRVLFELRGARLYDWRLDSTAGGSGTHRHDDVDTWEYTENPVVMEYNYRRGLSWGGDPFCGMGMPAADLPLDKWTTAANICDEDVDGEPRYRASIIVSSDADHRQVIEALSRSTGGMAIDGVTGAWPLIGTDQPIVATLTDDDLVAGGRPEHQDRRSVTELVNSVQGTFVDPDNQWSPTPYETQTDSTIVAIDRLGRDVRMDFPTVRSARQAEQLAAIYFSENRFESRISNLTVRPRWRGLEVGDWIRFNSESYGDKKYLIVGRRIQALENARVVVLDLQERDGSIYTSVGVVTPPIVPPANQAPAYLAQVQGFAIVPVTLTGDGGAAQAGLRASWSQITDPTVTGVQIEYRPKADPSRTYTRQIYDSVTVVFLSEGVVEQTEYEIRTLLLTTGRQATASAWQTVTTTTLPALTVQVSLENLNEDVLDRLVAYRGEIDALEQRIEKLAASTGAALGEQQINTQTLIAGSGNALAAVLEEQIARAEADSALASSLAAVSASVDDATASGLFKMEAVVPPPSGIDARISLLARASDGESYAESGLVLEVYTDGVTKKGRAIVAADQFIVTDGSNEHLPMVFSAGVLALNIANIGTVTAGTVKSSDDSMIIDLSAPSITMDDGT